MKEKKKSKGKKALKIILGIIIAIIVIVGAYVAYVFIVFHRLEDNLPLEVRETGETLAQAETGREMKIVSFNMGFGAYSDDYTFFMDGGKESRARSVEALTFNLTNAAEAVRSYNPDFILIQEIDESGTRTYHVDEREIITPIYAADAPLSFTYAQNYDSPFLMYPIFAPHGANKAGIMTYSKYGITSATRYSLPIEEGVSKVVDLDRCYSKQRIPASNGKELIVYNLHLSAYTTTAGIAEEQLSMIIEDMQAEYDAGNYCIAGGDFNRDLLGNSPEIFNVPAMEDNWAKPINMDLFTDDITLVAPFDSTELVASCRNNDVPYVPGNFVVTVDGFVVSANVEVKSAKVIDLGFKYSDHNPVIMSFILK
ncbi:MAG: endonuclease/exonuclease/phosphatase family protein [Lachnospiraceae bacterium]|nr:endonuclease/exonuclease/phosphatase family protein [Lachnospiraceae bacterium]